MSTQQQTASTPRMRNVQQNSVGLNDSVKNAVENPNAENLLALATLFTPLREYGMQALRFTAGYSRRHPIRMAVSAVALGYLASRIFKPATIAKAVL